MARQRLPEHVGFIPDGNRRWAVAHGLAREHGYAHGVKPGIALFEACRARGIPEISIFGFTQDNTRRATAQTRGFSAACVAFAQAIAARGAALLVVGDPASRVFPDELRPFRRRSSGDVRVNLLVNYGWDWDLQGLRDEGTLRSREISRLDLIVRWGGGRRLSGFLPVQSVYADFYVVEDYWPDFHPAHFEQALAWFALQDRTLGG
jgi:undecaprenyl diphosphate synthase